MDRINKIENFAKQKYEEAQMRETKMNQQIEEYKQQIRMLKPRIDELLEVGNACLEHSIPLTGRGWGCHEGYDTHQFITNGWSHLLGFVKNHSQATFTKLGIEGGGACNYNLETDGDMINVTGDKCYVLKKFVDNFDRFESEFYKYVDKVTGQ